MRGANWEVVHTQVDYPLQDLHQSAQAKRYRTTKMLRADFHETLAHRFKLINPKVSG